MAPTFLPHPSLAWARLRRLPPQRPQLLGESLASCVSLNRSSRNNAASCGCPPARSGPALPPLLPCSSSSSPIVGEVGRRPGGWGHSPRKALGARLAPCLPQGMTAGCPCLVLRVPTVHSGSNGAHFLGPLGRPKKGVSLSALLWVQVSSCYAHLTEGDTEALNC